MVGRPPVCPRFNLIRAVGQLGTPARQDKAPHRRDVSAYQSLGTSQEGCGPNGRVEDRSYFLLAQPVVCDVPYLALSTLAIPAQDWRNGFQIWSIIDTAFCDM
jgi:hypothetical protein